MGLVGRHSVRKILWELTAMLAELKRGGLTFPHVGVLRASANFEKGILLKKSKKGTPTPGKGWGVTSYMNNTSSLVSLIFFEIFFQLFI